MKKSLFLILALLISLGFSNLQSQNVSDLKTANILTPEPGSVIEIYEYSYPNNTTDLNENQQIELIKSKSGYVGFFHGISDEFDKAREGYLPGFFVLQMQNLKIEKESISFSLLPTPEDMFNKPIPLTYRTSIDAKSGGYQKWTNSQIMRNKSPKLYSGIIKGTSLIIKDSMGKEIEYKKK